MKRNLSWLLDGRLKTNFEDSGLGGGVCATYFTQIDELSSVDSAGATRIAEPDGFSRHFSDAISENVYYKTIALADRTITTSPTEWKTGDTFTVALPVSSDGLLSRVVELGTLSGYGSTEYVVTGYNTQTLTIKLIAAFESSIPSGSRTNISLYVKVRVVYNGNEGLSRTPYFYQNDIVVGASLTALNTGDNLVWQTSPPSGMVTSGLDTDSMLYKPSRTATLLVNYTVTDYSVYSRTTTTTVVPDEIRSVQGIFDAVSDPGKTTNLYLGISGENTIQHSVVASAHREMIVDYTPKRPVPEGAKLLLYYRTSSQQSLKVVAGGLNVSTLKIHVLYAPDWLYTTSAGSGSHTAGYPYVSPSHQIPSSDATLTDGDHLLNYNQPLNVDGFGSSGQFIQLDVKVPLAYIPYFNFKNPDQDSEYRNYYSDVDTTSYDDIIDGSASIYQPSVFAQRLQNNVPHKVIYPCIGLCLEDTNVGKRGSLILMVFTRSSTDDQNAVIFDSADGGDSCVALYRLKGNPILSIRKHQLGFNLI